MSNFINLFDVAFWRNDFYGSEQFTKENSNKIANFNNCHFSICFVFQRHRKDVSNFDRQFTSEKTDLTPTDKLFMMNLDQNEFAGFSFLNPEFVQHV